MLLFYEMYDPRHQGDANRVNRYKRQSDLPHDIQGHGIGLDHDKHDTQVERFHQRAGQQDPAGFPQRSRKKRGQEAAKHADDAGSHNAGDSGDPSHGETVDTCDSS